MVGVYIYICFGNVKTLGMDLPSGGPCWIALDDVSEENGTVYVLPFSQVGIRTWVKHEQDPETNDKVGYFGDLKGVPIVCPAGSIAVFTSYNFHSSGPNTTDDLRRVYLAQYSCEPIQQDGQLKGSAEPVLIGGVRQHFE